MRCSTSSSRLVDKSLVLADDLGRRCLATACWRRSVSTLGTDVEWGETDPVRHRHLEWFLAYAEPPSPNWVRLPDRRGWTASMRSTTTCSQRSSGPRSPAGQETVLRLATALSLFWEARGHRHQGIGGRWFARALAVDHGPSTARARALWAAAHMGIYGGDTLATITWAPQALAVAEAVGDQRTVARAGITTNYFRSLFAPEEGMAGLTEGVELARSIGDQWAVADGLKMMTITWAARGDDVRGLAVAQELAQVAERLGNKFFMAWSQAVIGYGALHQRRLPGGPRPAG